MCVCVCGGGGGLTGNLSILDIYDVRSDMNVKLRPDAIPQITRTTL